MQSNTHSNHPDKASKLSQFSLGFEENRTMFAERKRTKQRTHAKISQ